MAEQEHDVRRPPDLAGVVLGGSVVHANDESFAAAHNLIAPGPAGHDAGSFRFVANAPGWARLSDVETGAELLPRTRLLPDTEHRFRVTSSDTVRLVRLDIYPDGGLSRLRLHGTIPETQHQQIAQRWLDLLPPDQAAAAAHDHFFD